MITQVTDVNHVLLESCHRAPLVPALALIQPRTLGWQGAAAALETPFALLETLFVSRRVGSGVLGRVSLFSSRCQLGGWFV